jgi:adenylate cyclase
VRKRSVFHLISAVAIVAAVTVISIAATRYLTLFGAAERWLSDLRITLLSPPEPQDQRIVIAAITEDTLAQLPYRSPVDRAFLAGLVRWLGEAGAAAVGIDILFDRPTEPAKDEALKAALEAAPMPVIVAFADASDGLTPAQVTYLDHYLEGLKPAAIAQLTDPVDGTVRWISPFRDRPAGRIPGFVPALAAAVGHAPPTRPITIAYRQPPDADTPPFRMFPAHRLTQLPKRWFKDKIVLIGAVLPDDDRHRTPMATALGPDRGRIPGIIIHAHALAQLLENRTAPEVSQSMTILVVALTTAAVVAVTALPISGRTQVAIGLALLLALWTAGFFIPHRWLAAPLPLISPSLGLALGFGLGTAYWGSLARHERTFIRDTFAKFTAPSIVNALIAEPERLRLGGERRDMTFVFTDLASFTTLIEQNDPARVLPAINIYLNDLCGIAFDHGGTIMKIVGDAVHVMFNAPVEQPDHAQRALACGLAMAACGAEFSRRQRLDGLDFGVTRVGVHSGAATVGNFGGDRFFDYTAHGDAVNTASRLETANKYLGTFVCCSRATAVQCPDYRFRPIGVLLVPGKTTGIEVLQPLLPGTLSEPALKAYLNAYALLESGDAKARDAFAELQRRWPDDVLIRLHADRLAAGEDGIVIVIKGK